MRMNGKTNPHWSLAPDFHPEFGYLCPSHRIRRTARLALIFISLATMIGAGTVLGLANPRADAGDRGESVLEPMLMRGAIEELSGASDLRTSVAEHDLARSRGACKDLTASFLDQTCRSTELRRRHPGRSNSRVATFVIGHADAPLPSPAVAQPAPEPKRDPIRPVRKIQNEPTPSSTLKAEQPAAPKQPKVAQDSTRKPGREDETRRDPWFPRDFGGWRSVP